MKENLFYELNITGDEYVIGRHNHDAADSVSIIGYTEESKHARLFCAAPELLEALQNLMLNYSDFRERTGRNGDPQNPLILAALAAINKATGETK